MGIRSSRDEGLKRIFGEALGFTKGFIKGFDNDIGRNLHYYQGNALMIGETADHDWLYRNTLCPRCLN